MIEFAKDGNATHAIQRLDLTGGVRGKGHKWKDIVRVRLDKGTTKLELIAFILLHKIATDREIQRHKIRTSEITQLERGSRSSSDEDYPVQP